LLRAIEDTDDVAQAAATARGRIRASAPQELGRMLIAPWAATFLDRYPEVRRKLGISDRFVDIIREGFDIAIRMGSLADSDLVSRKIGDIRFVLAASPDYISRNKVPDDIEDLGRHLFVRYVASG
jgi:DNA-binding transcriptional LysR family regulator